MLSDILKKFDIELGADVEVEKSEILETAFETVSEYWDDFPSELQDAIQEIIKIGLGD